MRQRTIYAVCTLVVVLLMPGMAAAVPAFSTANVNMRASPGVENPVVATIPGGSPVEIVGCLNGWSWCDTVWAGNRGWVAGAYLNAPWRGTIVPFVSHAPRLGVPILAYSGEVYWRRHYVGKPWYPRRARRPVHGCVRGPYGGVACR